VATDDDVRRIALALPETDEHPSYGGRPSWRVKKKFFLGLRTDEEGGLVAKVGDLDEKASLLDAEPEKFFTTPHYDGYAIVLVRLPAVDVDELEELITESWRLTAPPRVLAAFDAAHPPTP